MNPIILFDGYCNLCNRSVNFIIRHDRKNLFRFMPLQSKDGEKILTEFNADSINKLDSPDSVILIYRNQIYYEADAAIKVFDLLGFPWNLLLVTRFIPGKILNKIYRCIANNRYKWFGRMDNCRIPEENGK